MPIQSCQRNNRPGFKYGDSGRCYTYTPGNKKSRREARRRAIRQAQAMFQAGFSEKAEKVRKGVEGWLTSKQGC